MVIKKLTDLIRSENVFFDKKFFVKTESWLESMLLWNPIQINNSLILHSNLYTNPYLPELRRIDNWIRNIYNYNIHIHIIFCLLSFFLFLIRHLSRCVSWVAALASQPFSVHRANYFSCSWAGANLSRRIKKNLYLWAVPHRIFNFLHFNLFPKN